MKWVEMWMYVKEDVEKMKDMNDEEVHETLGSAQIYSAEMDGRIITAVMIEMALREKYLFMPETMRAIQIKNPKQFTALENITMSTIRVDRSNWVEENVAVDIDKVKTLKFIEAMSEIGYFDEMMKDLKRKVCNSGNQLNPMPLYWPDRSWIKKKEMGRDVDVREGRRRKDGGH